MATHLDLEEQEQLDQLKAFWKDYGNLITWALIAVLGAYAAWNGWNYWQRDQASRASAIFEELDKAAQAGDVARTAGIFNDLRERFPRTTLTQQAGLLTAKVQVDKGQVDAGAATLEWVGQNAAEAEYQTVARLRLAGVLLDQNPHEPLHRAQDGPVDHHGRLFRVILCNVGQLEPLRHGEIELERAELPGTFQAILDMEVDLRSVERPIALVDLERDLLMLQSRLEGVGASPPDFIRADVILRLGG